MDGFFIVDKPIGITSHDVVYRLKKKFNLNKIGHTGTLDPFASGLMIICVGKATKLSHLFQNQDKKYIGTILLGKHYDTYDVTGTVLDQRDTKLDEALIDQHVSSLIKSYQQVPPMYSAIKIKGQKLYELARKGIEVERAGREVTIFDFKRTSPYQEESFEFETHVSKGTYIRSLAFDLASQMNTFGALKTLRRTSVGKISIEQAKTLDRVSIEDLWSVEFFLKDVPSIILSDYLIKLVKNGVYLDQRQLITDQPFIVRNEKQELIAYYEVIKEHTYAPIVIF